MGNYFHSVILKEESCNGCTHCIKRCPTEAIRVRNRKASIFGEKCIDCGECIKVCPYHAQKAVTDDLEDTKRYKYKIALVPPVVHGQFDTGGSIGKVLKAVEMLGFDRAYDISPYSDVVSAIIRYYIHNNLVRKPAISSDCPAIVRLIQLRYPDLLGNIIPIDSPMEVAARLIKKEIIREKNFRFGDIGVFYLTPCPAKVTSIRVPLGINMSYTDGAISVQKVFAGLCRNFKELQNVDDVEGYEYSGRGIGWGRVGGQSYSIDSKHYLAVDGIENVIKILEELELGKLGDVDFLEAYGCIGGCVGGPLLVENSFIAKRRIRFLSETIPSPPLMVQENVKDLLETGLLNWTEEIKPKKLISLDHDIKQAINKMRRMEEILKGLPNIDCGSCGAPTCRAMAEDIVNGRAREEDCIFKLREKVKKIGE
jgi:Na+-translocating ferredoxin:NAD+ oxidoreductase RNF subunit RnfB